MSVLHVKSDGTSHQVTVGDLGRKIRGDAGAFANVSAADWEEYGQWLDRVDLPRPVPAVLALLARLRWSLIDQGRNPGLLLLASWMGDDGYEE
jgi:hypothetical protein